MTGPRVSESDVDKAFAAVSGAELLNGLLEKISPDRVEERFESELQRLLEKRIDSRKPVDLDQFMNAVRQIDEFFVQVVRLPQS